MFKLRLFLWGLATFSMLSPSFFAYGSAKAKAIAGTVGGDGGLPWQCSPETSEYCDYR